jgi:hypothetical protein
VSGTVLLDNSAWARLPDPVLSDSRVTELADALNTGRIATSLPFRWKPATPLGALETTTI